MSVKILGVKGARVRESYEPNIQDIVTQNCDIFFIDTIADYLIFLTAIYKSKVPLIWGLLTHFGQARALRSITKHAPKSLLTEHDWSGSAYSLWLANQGDASCPGVNYVGLSSRS